jgi:hypothetical protein
MSDEEKYCLTEAFNSSQRILNNLEDLNSMCTEAEITEIAVNCITHENVNQIVYRLVNSNTQLATELFNELAYWIEKPHL